MTKISNGSNVLLDNFFYFPALFNTEFQSFSIMFRNSWQGSTSLWGLISLSCIHPLLYEGEDKKNSIESGCDPTVDSVVLVLLLHKINAHAIFVPFFLIDSYVFKQWWCAYLEENSHQGLSREMSYKLKYMDNASFQVQPIYEEAAMLIKVC